MINFLLGFIIVIIAILLLLEFWMMFRQGRSNYMRTKCANCGVIYDISVSDMDMRSSFKVFQSGRCPGCGSNAHNPNVSPKRGRGENGMTKLLFWIMLRQEQELMKKLTNKEEGR